MRWFWLYRPQLPSPRAQAIQVVNMAHAMARRGHEVRLVADSTGEGELDKVLDYYGLMPHPGLHLSLLPAKKTWASLVFRAQFAQWARGGGVVYARSKKYTGEVARFFPGLPLVLEAHEVDSLQAEERGESPEPWLRLERTALGFARGIVTNTAGTLRRLQQQHRALPPTLVAQNGGSQRIPLQPDPDAVGIGYVGSLRSCKGLDDVAEAARRTDLPMTLVTGDDPAEWVRRSGGRLRVEGALRPREVLSRLRRFRVLVLPLSTGLFGEDLTSPLKLWDYLASGVPIVGADTPALREAAEGRYYPYIPGDVESLVRAFTEAYTSESVRQRLCSPLPLRTWEDRAAEIEAFVQQVVR